MRPIVNGLKPKYADKMDFSELNMYDESSRDLVKQYDIQVHPTFITVNAQGTKADQIIGGTTEQRFVAAIEKAIQ